MNFLVELIVVAAVFGFIVYISRIGSSENRYEYVEEKDEEGNIIEKVVDHKDKGEE